MNIEPDTTEPPPRINDCICPVYGDGPNPTCQPHGWWNRDPKATELADAKDPWAAALKTFGGDA